jgi:hypothetical protein
VCVIYVRSFLTICILVLDFVGRQCRSWRCMSAKTIFANLRLGPYHGLRVVNLSIPPIHPSDSSVSRVRRQPKYTQSKYLAYQIIHRFSVPNLYRAKRQPNATTILLLHQLDQGATVPNTHVRSRDTRHMTDADSTKTVQERGKLAALTKVRIIIGIESFWLNNWRIC